MTEKLQMQINIDSHEKETCEDIWKQMTEKLKILLDRLLTKFSVSRKWNKKIKDLEKVFYMTTWKTTSRSNSNLRGIPKGENNEKVK